MPSFCTMWSRRPQKGMAMLFAVTLVSMALNFSSILTKATENATDLTSLDFPIVCQQISGMQESSQNLTLVDTLKHRPRLFHCGGYASNRNLKPTLKSIFPEYEWFDLRRVGDWRSDEMLASASNPWDLFVSNYQLDECRDPSFFQWLHLRFAGKVIFWTPEDGTNYLAITPRPNYFSLGPGAPFTLTFLQTAYWAQIPEEDKHGIFYEEKKEIESPSVGEHFLIYAHSNCVEERQAAFRTIANCGDGTLPTVYFGGRCNGNINQMNGTRVREYPNKVRLVNWEDNRHVFKDFRFCLTMEHVKTPGYITEKILVAFWAGCVPIYWGPEEIYDIFNEEAFIYWDVDNPQPALERIMYLERNRSAYEEMIQKPILASGASKKYFSLDEEHGGGNLKQRLRQYIGLNKYEYV